MTQIARLLLVSSLLTLVAIPNARAQKTQGDVRKKVRIDENHPDQVRRQEKTLVPHQPTLVEVQQQKEWELHRKDEAERRAKGDAERKKRFPKIDSVANWNAKRR